MGQEGSKPQVHRAQEQQHSPTRQPHRLDTVGHLTQCRPGSCGRNGCWLMQRPQSHPRDRCPLSARSPTVPRPEQVKARGRGISAEQGHRNPGSGALQASFHLKLGQQVCDMEVSTLSSNIYYGERITVIRTLCGQPTNGFGGVNARTQRW